MDRLTDSGKAMLKDRYLLPNEDCISLFKRVANAYGSNLDHASRILYYMQKCWFMPATPILSNGGTNRGLPISCFTNEANDSLSGIVDLWNENIWLAARGGGIGSYWGNLRSIGEKIGVSGRTSGIIPFIAVQNSLTLAISQGSLRRGSSVVYLPVSHPEIEEFIDLRKPTGGDPNRKALNLHNGVVITDKFMQAVENDDPWDLVSPLDNTIVRTIGARQIWIRILTARVEIGEPYILFIDSVNDKKPELYKRLNLDIKTSNLCSEITLTTGLDHKNKERTGVCCLSSVNLTYFDEWENNEIFIEDIMRFLDNVLQDFIDRAPSSMERAKYAATRERSIGLGVMGLHSMLQKKMIPFDSVITKVLNKKIFSFIAKQADLASKKLAAEKGPCLDAIDAKLNERFTHKTAIAPTASISIIAGNSSPGIEPYISNAFTQKTLSGSFPIKNPYLKSLLQERGEDNDAVWSSITTNDGSVQHLSFLTEFEKSVFKTAYELDQRIIIELAADRTPFICQAQSVNIFLPATVSKRYLHKLHEYAWKKGVKSLYYCRSMSIQRADKVSHSITEEPKKYEECLYCQ
ncbi:Ribonucleoside-diphosphate reductase [Candidatus Xenohaliotis californiensis]|uniref:Ribonucleoside-diphosphate reductase n=1 Tax=Candidatus Xenohaliotis californiensis TaxID=84677 RepID=A0ABP0ESX8_9RICK|nr:Ribonucleoside-diphosphate reductase [Candidatus Xenohaliotis californiensis]